MKIFNPVLKGFNPDPSICRVGNDYYIAVSTFEWFPGVRIYHSKDLNTWNFVCSPLNRLSQLNMLGNSDSGGVWAPCLSYSEGKFWLIFSDVKVTDSDYFKDGKNFLVTSDRIDGDWSEPTFLNSSGFDPSLFHDEDGKKYLLNMVRDYRSNQHRFYGIVLQEYSPLENKLIGEKQIIFKGTDLGLTEAPHIYRKNDFYYLVVAEGGTTYEHAVTVTRAKNIAGPYEVHPENPILTSWNDPENPLQKAGHASFVETQNEEEWYLAHLTSRPIRLPGKKLLQNRGYCPLGRETAIQKLDWKNDWPYVVAGPFPSLMVMGLNGTVEKEIENKPQHCIEDFDVSTLPDDFQTLRIPFDDELGSLTERSGFLRLFGRESMHSRFYQSLVARRWQSLNFEVETSLEFEPDNFQQLAGLIFYYNTRNWVSLHLTHDEVKGKILSILRCDQYLIDMPLENQEIVVPNDVETVYLKGNVSGLTFNFSYSFDRIMWHVIDENFDSYKLSDDYVNQGGAFTGAFVGMHCVDISGEKKTADFDYFNTNKV